MTVLTKQRVTEAYVPGTLPRRVENELRAMTLEAIAEVMAEQAVPPEEEEEELGEQVAPLEDEDELLDEEAIVDSILEQAADVQDELDQDEEELLTEQVPPLDEEEPYLMEEPVPILLSPEEEEAELAEAMVVARIGALETRLELDRSGRILEGALRQARLPRPMADVIRQQFAGRIFEYEELADMIKGLKEAAIAMDQSGRVHGAGLARGGGRVQMGLTGLEQAEVEFLRMVGGNHTFRTLENHEDETVQERLWTPAFQSWVNAGRPRQSVRRLSNLVYELLGGDPFGDQRAYEAVSTSGMTSIVKNTLNLLLAASYAKRHQWWGPIVREEEVDTIDDATLVRIYGMNTLDEVAEGGPYTELPWADEEETAAFHKRGNFVGITLETLLNDKLNVVRSIPDRLATSWYNTLSSLVSGVFTVNSAAGPALADTGALFNANALTVGGGHANLRTTALSFTEYDAVVTAMQKQTDQALGAGQRLLIEPKYALVPPDLRTTALQIRNSELIPGSANNDINPHQGSFEVVVVPDWTDTNNFAMVADPAQFPAIWLLFLRGRKVPELFTADSEVAGTMFTNDTIRYKVRMLTWRFSATYSCAPVSDWRALHKSNVAG